jgi:hypothetical protein
VFFYILRICIFVQLKKAFYILFAFYFIALLALPCGDKEDCNEVKHEQTAHNSSSEDHSDEMCTPFCVCSCCAAHFVVKSFEPLHNEIAVINTVYTAHKEAETASAIIPVWQPPKRS